MTAIHSTLSLDSVFGLRSMLARARASVGKGRRPLAYLCGAAFAGLAFVIGSASEVRADQCDTTVMACRNNCIAAARFPQARALCIRRCDVTWISCVRRQPSTPAHNQTLSHNQRGSHN